MPARSRELLLLVTACIEAATGLGLLFVPAVPFALLLGAEDPAAETAIVGRLAGAALLAIGIASWIARTDAPSAAQLGLLIGILVYDAAASMLLAFAGAVLQLSGVLLWPAVALHAVLAAWCLGCIRKS
jgi:hypothetical protein